MRLQENYILYTPKQNESLEKLIRHIHYLLNNGTEYKS